VDAITEFAKMRGLSLSDARVQDWQDNTTPPNVATPLAAPAPEERKRQSARSAWVGLTDEELDQAWRSLDYTVSWAQHRIYIALAIEAKLKEKNT
jgi:hypothetical protein